MRGALEAALAALRCSRPTSRVRAAAIDELQGQARRSRKLPLVEKAYAAETDAGAEGAARAGCAPTVAGLVVRHGQAPRRRHGAGDSSQSAVASAAAASAWRRRRERRRGARGAAAVARRGARSRLAWGERLGVVFTGISLGSILLLVALGLAITYGLMGVINMAHGELMMIGAYATYVVQNLFRAYLPGAFDAYVLVAIPVAFLAAALVGAMLERGVIRWLYGRPLETLLATWGISLVLQQAVRSIFGAQNVPVENPAWLSRRRRR